MKNPFLKYAYVLILVATLSSCSFLSYKMMGSEGRNKELRTISAKLVKALSWAEYGEVAKFMDLKIRDKGLSQLSDQYGSVKIKEVKETNLDFDDDVLVAYQVVEIDGFSAPSYVVKSEYTQFTWEFSPSTDGWKITEITFSTKEDRFNN